VKIFKANTSKDGRLLQISSMKHWRESEKLTIHLRCV